MTASVPPTAPAAPSVDDGSSVDRRIGDYRVLGTLGAGSVADVYLVEHLRGSRHALKALRLANRRRRERLHREGQLLASLRHPNVVRVDEVIDDGVTTGLVLELVEGPTLAQLLRAYQPSVAQADDLARQLFDGLEAAHRAGLVHRDLKPANVLLSVAGEGVRVKVGDFGLAKALGHLDEGTDPTQTGATMGTPRYMAPEQFRSAKHADQRADLFSLGAVLYELVTGAPAFVGSDVIALFEQASSGAYRPLHELAPQLPERMGRAVQAALQADRRQRVASVAELRALWCDDEPASPRPWEARHLATLRTLVPTARVTEPTLSVTRSETGAQAPVAPAQRPTVPTPPSQRATVPASPPPMPSLVAEAVPGASRAWSLLLAPTAGVLGLLAGLGLTLGLGVAFLVATWWGS
mgnify:CR=1 FL=1